MVKTCPHCGNKFDCKENDIYNCDCLSVNLSPKSRAYIASHYNECLCVKCLRYFEETIKVSS